MRKRGSSSLFMPKLLKFEPYSDGVGENEKAYGGESVMVLRWATADSSTLNEGAVRVLQSKTLQEQKLDFDDIMPINKRISR